MNRISLDDTRIKWRVRADGTAVVDKRKWFDLYRDGVLVGATRSKAEAARWLKFYTEEFPKYKWEVK